MAEILSLITERDVCRSSVIETIEKALQQAKDGEILAVGLAVVRPDHAVCTSWSQTDVVGTLLGAVTLLQKKMVDQL